MSESINALLEVSHHEDIVFISVPAAHQPDYCLLDGIAVLVLINEHFNEPAAVHLSRLTPQTLKCKVLKVIIVKKTMLVL